MHRGPTNTVWRQFRKGNVVKRTYLIHISGLVHKKLFLFFLVQLSLLNLYSTASEYLQYLFIALIFLIVYLT